MSLQGGPHAHTMAHDHHSYHPPGVRDSGHFVYWVFTHLSSKRLRWHEHLRGNVRLHHCPRRQLVTAIFWSHTAIPLFYPRAL